MAVILVPNSEFPSDLVSSRFLLFLAAAGSFLAVRPIPPHSIPRVFVTVSAFRSRPPNPNISHPLWNPFQLQTLGSPDIISPLSPLARRGGRHESGVEEWRSSVKNSRGGGGGGSKPVLFVALLRRRDVETSAMVAAVG